MGDEPGENDLKKAKDTIDHLEKQVKQGKETGIEFSEVEGIIQGARLMLDTGAMLDAQELIDQCTEMINLRFTEFEDLNTNIKKLETNIDETTLGDDIAEAVKNLKMAKYHQKTGYYRLGNDYAKRGLKLFS